MGNRYCVSWQWYSAGLIVLSPRCSSKVWSEVNQNPLLWRLRIKLTQIATRSAILTQLARKNTHAAQTGFQTGNTICPFLQEVSRQAKVMRPIELGALILMRIMMAWKTSSVANGIVKAWLIWLCSTFYVNKCSENYQREYSRRDSVWAGTKWFDEFPSFPQIYLSSKELLRLGIWDRIQYSRRFVSSWPRARCIYDDYG